ncbi:Photox toxin [compost metagenome]
MALSAISGSQLHPQSQAHSVSTNPLLTQGNKLFEQSVQRGIGHFQSADLKSVISALRQLQTAPDAGKAQRVQDAIQHWEQHHPKEVAARGTRLNELKQVLAEQGAIARPQQQAPKVMAGGTHALLQQSMAGLEKLGSYACTDAQTFVQPSNPDYQKIIGKLSSFGQDPQRLAANQRANNSANMAAIQITRNKQPLSLRTMENIAKAVDEAKAGCCSTLAYSAATELLRHNSEQRIEVLAHRGAHGHSQTHCFVVVGRAEGSDLGKPQSWGPDARVVDPWAATIGARLIGTADRPPIANLWPPTESVFDTAARES